MNTMFHIQKIQAELVARGRSLSHGGGVSHKGANLYASSERGEVSLLEAKFDDRWVRSFLVIRFKSKVCE
jgi:hypothetical protein